jgi:transcription antitermination factor NusG
MEEELAEYERGLEEIFRQEPVRVNGRFIHVPPASFVVGQTIKVSDGPLKGMKGRIVTVHPLEGRLSVSFEVMGKELREEIHYCEVCRDTIN